ncbi:GNAT family N-acetyltransferase [Exiguobacterium sp. SH1S21]|uniref:GNAT family N-acetyltransferase n=1 Tax=Exiguobacterium sp. SH1S21 TaxID=2510953 RepID=UPI0010406955|nr:GNAT family N-acetyltransferase [Exiguobacterium sp. SH1S21]TCI53374.1 GNAT family N-acetyltransferase [Exiguobacterium sp. SH1S21]
MLTIEHGNDTSLIERARSVREVVFIGEQGIDPALEYDDLDPVCIHFVGMIDGEPVTTARMRPIGDGVGKVERVATLASARGNGYAKKLMLEIEDVARESGLHELKLGAQLTALPFYERLDYTTFGDEFLDADIPHRMMKKSW